MIGWRAVGLLLGSLTLACAARDQLRTADLIANTNEPFYQVQVIGNVVRLDGVGVPSRSMRVSRRLPLDAGVRVEAADAAGSLRLDLIERQCLDDMSGAPFPLSATLTIGGRSHRGCARRRSDPIPQVPTD